MIARAASTGKRLRKLSVDATALKRPVGAERQYIRSAEVIEEMNERWTRCSPWPLHAGRRQDSDSSVSPKPRETHGAGGDERNTTLYLQEEYNRAVAYGDVKKARAIIDHWIKLYGIKRTTEQELTRILEEYVWNGGKLEPGELTNIEADQPSSGTPRRDGG